MRQVRDRVRDELARRRRPRWGNLRRARPFSASWGRDRGTPIDRHYLDLFFAAHGSDISGRVLEVKDPQYTSAFGVDVEHLDLVDIAPANADATVLADLAEGGSLPAETWDCIVMPQTLQFVDDPAVAVSNAWQALRPGGVLLVSVPAVSRVDTGLPNLDRWRMLPTGLRFLLESACPGGDIAVDGFGSLVTTTAFLLGLAAEELSPDELVRYDEVHALLSCGRARRP
jgi:SAM-dependent methyltransferase